MATQTAIANTVFQIDWKTKKGTQITGNAGFVEFHSDKDCVIYLKDKEVFGCTVIELRKDTPRILPVLKNKTTGWYAEPMSRFTSKMERNVKDPQDPPVIG